MMIQTVVADQDSVTYEPRKWPSSLSLYLVVKTPNGIWEVMGSNPERDSALFVLMQATNVQTFHPHRLCWQFRLSIVYYLIAGQSAKTIP